jgi:homogentisate 1,2-dioxygenase
MDIDNECKILVVESNRPVETPERYRNKFGQLLEHSPFCERDICTPKLTDAINEMGEFLVKVRVNDGIQEIVYGHHPFDVVGWDGYYFPWIFNINDFEPIVGSIHQPPPVHQVFQSEGFVICSFVSRLFDFHPNAIPAPYPHSNVDSDEFIFYSLGDFMSRTGIEAESISYHPMGLPHGPQPGKYEDSIGKEKTEELAVMIDTFKPLHVASSLSQIDDKEYHKSWI